jgi:rhomboid protease GluP
MLAQQNGMVLGHAYWQLFTSIFVTDSFEDALFNALAVIILEYFLPDTFNKTRYFAIFFFAAILGNIFTLAEGPNYASAGASGGIFGVFAAAFAYNWAERKRIDGATLVLFFILFFGSSFLFVQNVPVDWIAHLGGSIAGFIAGPLLYHSLRSSDTGVGLSSKSTIANQAALAAVIAFMVVGSIIQFLVFLATG